MTILSDSSSGLVNTDTEGLGMPQNMRESLWEPRGTLAMYYRFHPAKIMTLFLPCILIKELVPCNPNLMIT